MEEPSVTKSESTFECKQEESVVSVSTQATKETKEISTLVAEEHEEAREFSPLGPVISSLFSDDGEEEEEDDRRSLLEISEPIDREAYAAEYLSLMTQQSAIRRKNQFLQYKLAAYFKKRKMDHVFKEDEIVEEMQAKYDKRLDDLCMLREKAFREQTEELYDIAYMQEQCKEQTEISLKEFKAMQTQEKETAKGLIDTRVGKVIPQEQVERLIARQNTKSSEIATIRLNYIKRREKVKNLETRLRSLETIDGNLHLIEYEQLRMENQNFADKIEERDEELTRLRVRYNVAVQALAHVREKSFIVDQNIDELTVECMHVEEEVTASRETMSDYKIKRDQNRNETNRLKTQSGLLTYTRLLNDMKSSMEEVERTRAEIELLKEKNKENRTKLDAIRRTIEQYTDKEVEVIPKPPVKKQVNKAVRVYRGRPSLMLPTLPVRKIDY